MQVSFPDAMRRSRGHNPTRACNYNGKRKRFAALCSFLNCFSKGLTLFAFFYEFIKLLRFNRPESLFLLPYTSKGFCEVFELFPELQQFLVRGQLSFPSEIQPLNNDECIVI